jgi:DNA-binding response OmpR family regulator
VSDVLIATDADWIHEEVAAALSDDTIRVQRVRAGREAAGAVSEFEPDLVVLDLQIGNMGGIATFLHLQQEAEEGRLPAVPVLLLLDRPADVPIARGLGLPGWLVKPVDAFRLRRAASALREGRTYHEPSGLATSVVGAD